MFEGTRKRVAIKFTTQLLKNVFQIPEDISVVGCEWSNMDDAIVFILEGDEFPKVPILEIPKIINPNISKDKNGNIVWDFNVMDK